MCPQRKTDASELEEDADLTEALEETLPASDPPSMTQPHGGHAKPGRRGPSVSGTEAELDRQRIKRTIAPTPSSGDKGKDKDP
jgi:hypothetical protein